MSALEALASNGQSDNHHPGSEVTIQTLRVYKDVCHRIRSALVAGRNEIVSPTTISKLLVKESLEKEEASLPNGEAPSAESPGGAMEHTTTEDSCPFLEQAEGWTVEYSGAGCEVGLHGDDSVSAALWSGGHRTAPCTECDGYLWGDYLEVFSLVK